MIHIMAEISGIAQPLIRHLQTQSEARVRPAEFQIRLAESRYT